MGWISSPATIKRIAAYGAIYLLWGGVYLAIRVLVTAIPPFLTAGVRYGLAAVCLLLVSLWRREPLPSKRQVFHASWTGVVMLVLGFGAVFWAERRMASWIVAVIASTSTLWTYLGEILLLRCRRFEGWAFVALIAGVGGVVLCAGTSAEKSGATWWAAMAVLLGAGSWSAGSLAIKHLDMPRSYLRSAMIQLAASGAVMAIVSYGVGEWAHLPPLRLLATPRLICAMLYLVVAASVVAFAAFHWLLQREPASMVATCTYVNPVVAMLLGIALAGEAHSAEELIGAAVILLSVFATWILNAGSGRAGMEPVPVLQE